MKKFSDSVKYIGADDKEIDLFESQYAVPNGISYNSYVILDEKIAVMDTIDVHKTDEWYTNLERELGGRTPDYLVISHLEPDHAANILSFTKKYPSAALVGSAKTFAMLPQFFAVDDAVEKIAVKEGDTLSLGSHELTFIMKRASRSFFPQTRSANSALWIRKRTGRARQGVTILTSWANTAGRCRPF